MSDAKEVYLAGCIICAEYSIQCLLVKAIADSLLGLSMCVIEVHCFCFISRIFNDVTGFSKHLIDIVNLLKGKA